jgi:hypothetical protein
MNDPAKPDGPSAVRLYPDPVRPRLPNEDVVLWFVCGAAVGALLGLFIVFKFFMLSSATVLLTVAFSSVVCGVSSVHFGQGFWDGLCRSLRFIRWF